MAKKKVGKSTKITGTNTYYTWKTFTHFIFFNNIIKAMAFQTNNHILKHNDLHASPNLQNNSVWSQLSRSQSGLPPLTRYTASNTLDNFVVNIETNYIRQISSMQKNTIWGGWSVWTININLLWFSTYLWNIKLVNLHSFVN